MLTPPSLVGAAWTESILWNFNSIVNDGFNPLAGLMMDAGGNLYGTTMFGGTGRYGTAFELKRLSGGANWTESILVNFNNNNGANPQAGLVMDKTGNLWGTTFYGGAVGRGTVFELVQTGIGGITKVAHSWISLDGTNLGSFPAAGLLVRNGKLYGTASHGGAFGFGTVFALSPPAINGKPLTKSNLWSFNEDINDGGTPDAGLLMDANGNLYGTTAFGGLETLGRCSS